MTGALALAGCGASSASSPPTTTTKAPSSHPGSGTPVVVVTTSDLTGHNGVQTITAKSGGKVEFELVSTEYRRGGSIAPWGTPTSSDPAVLAPAATPPGTKCAANATCTFFDAKSAGVASVRVVGPSGIICGKSGSGCIAVTAMMGQVKIKVTAA